jgi:hypothetical protein
MRSIVGSIRIGAVVVLTVFAFTCASSEPKSDLNIDVNDQEIRVAVSAAVARGLMEELIGSDLDCQGEIDTGMRRLLQELDQGGPRSRASFRDGETTIAARRRGGRLDLDIRGAGSGRIEATMPWAVADCLLGKTTTIDKTVTSSIKVKVTNEDGRNFSFQLN